MQTFPIEMQIFYRDHQNGIYRVLSYYLSKSLVELPLHIILPCVFTLIYYWMSNLNPNIDRFFIWLFISVITAQVCISFGK